MKRKSLEDILNRRISAPYQDQYGYIKKLLEEGKIEPVKSSPLNGKRPALHTMYWIKEPQKDFSHYEDELVFMTHPMIIIDYYMRNLNVYDQERDAVRALHYFLENRRAELRIPVSFNERCFAIWGQEKFLTQHNGKTILKHCGIDLKFLNCYPTVEPFAYFANDRSAGQNILILENKDPFYSMRRHLLADNSTILGKAIGTLIYGAGKRVVSSFKDFDITAEPYMKAPTNTLLYFGDLDYEGIGIYENLVEAFGNQGTIVPFAEAYMAMLDKADELKNLHPTKEQQNRNIGTEFFSYFDADTVARMKAVLEQDLYIPQEILNITDF